MENQNNFKQTLGLFDGTMVVAGSMIGSGIFIVSADITKYVGSPGMLLLVWLITGFMTISAALSYGELASMFPKAGGQYVYLKEAFGKLTGFLYGWSFFAVIQTATIAAVGVAFSKFLGTFNDTLGTGEAALLADFGFTKLYTGQLVAIGLIIFLTFINTRGQKESKAIQLFFTAAKLIALFGLIIFGFLFVKESYWAQNWQLGFDATQMAKGADGKFIKDGAFAAIAGSAVVGAIVISMTGSVFSSDAWNSVTFIAGEMKNPKRTVGLSLLFGALIVTVIYVLINMMYINVMPMSEIANAAEGRVAVAAAAKIAPEYGKSIIAILIMVSTFGCNNGLIMAGARVYYTMANDGLFFKKAGTLNKNNVPELGLWIQCIVCCLWCLSGKYGDLLDMISFVVVMFYVVTILGIYKLRKTQPNTERPYKAFGYPVLPALYVLMGTAFCVLLIIYKPEFTWPGLLITLAGIPIYFLAMGNKKNVF
jgi:basic amino acid/polyamine antiporter, APA family